MEKETPIEKYFRWILTHENAEPRTAHIFFNGERWVIEIETRNVKGFKIEYYEAVDEDLLTALKELNEALNKHSHKIPR